MGGDLPGSGRAAAACGGWCDRAGVWPGRGDGCGSGYGNVSVDGQHWIARGSFGGYPGGAGASPGGGPPLDLGEGPGGGAGLGFAGGAGVAGRSDVAVAVDDEVVAEPVQRVGGVGLLGFHGDGGGAVAVPGLQPSGDGQFYRSAHGEGMVDGGG